MDPISDALRDAIRAMHDNGEVMVSGYVAAVEYVNPSGEIDLVVFTDLDSPEWRHMGIIHHAQNVLEQFEEIDED